MTADLNAEARAWLQCSPVDAELTPRQAAVVRLLAVGLAAEETAAELRITVKSLQGHVRLVRVRLRGNAIRRGRRE